MKCAKNKAHAVRSTHHYEYCNTSYYIIKNIFQWIYFKSNFTLQSLTLSNYGFWSSIFFIVQQRQVEKNIAINSEIMKIFRQLFQMIKVFGHWLHLSLSHYNGPSDGYPDTHLLIEAKLRQWWSKCSARWRVGTPRPHTPEHGEINIRCRSLIYYHVSLNLSSRERMNVHILLDHNLPEYNKCFHQ